MVAQYSNIKFCVWNVLCVVNKAVLCKDIFKYELDFMFLLTLGIYFLRYVYVYILYRMLCVIIFIILSLHRSTKVLLT